MTQLRYLNLGCGRIILPAERPAHYALIDDITQYALWHNVDRNAEPGVDEVVDIFRYPFPWANNSFDGALCAHICEHIPHEIRIAKSSTDVQAALYAGVKMGGDLDAALALRDRISVLETLQDGWYAFFAELHRVLTPGSIIHVLSPYAWSHGGVTDPTHTRLLTEHSFTHSMQPDASSPFKYATGGLNLELEPPVRFHFSPLAQPYLQDEAMLQRAIQTHINVVNELYVKLRVVK